MTSGAVIWGGLILVGVILLSILGTVHRREKFAFVGGIVLLIAGQTLGVGSAAIGGVIGFVGIVLVVGSTVPLLRQSAIIE